MMTPAQDSRPTGMINALTFDVEDYYHVSAFDEPGKREQWDTFESRVCRNTDRVLELLAGSSVTATFFVLGWVADRYPDLVRRIAAAGHELASHGYSHRLVYDMTPVSFRDDLRRAKDAIGAASGFEVRGFRAPSFSITARSLWALDILAEEGYAFDSSIYPIRRDRYGLPGAPRFIHTIVRPAGRIIEVPPSTTRVSGMTLPVGGGGYFRLYPFALTRLAFARLNAKEHQPAVVYLHPWEIDPAQPRQRGSQLSIFRHYVNIGRTEARLRRLLTLFHFAPLTAVLAQARRAEVAVQTGAAAPIDVVSPAAHGGAW
jgi:polysaccharide deacetylase family protein (PEP-CTERM system associated)